MATSLKHLFCGNLLLTYGQNLTLSNKKEAYPTIFTTLWEDQKNITRASFSPQSHLYDILLVSENGAFNDPS